MTAPPAGALEACPVCGGEAELRGAATQRYVGCLTDRCVDGPYGDFDDAAAIAAWNRRAHGPALLAALRLREWRPIASAPKDGTLILLATPQGVFAACWEQWAPGEYWFGNEYVEHDDATHWMPLPAPPTADDIARAILGETK